MEGRASGLVLRGRDLLSREDSPKLAQSVLQNWGRLNCAFGQRGPSSFALRFKLWLRALSLIAQTLALPYISPTTQAATRPSKGRAHPQRQPFVDVYVSLGEVTWSEKICARGRSGGKTF